MDIRAKVISLSVSSDEAVFLHEAVFTELARRVRQYAENGTELAQFKKDHANEIKMYHDLVKLFNVPSNKKNTDFDQLYKNRIVEMK